MFKSGFVSVIGRPNVGKSTLLNRLIGEKISIISDKAQTTRNKINLIYSDEDSQIVFLDTPGIQDPRNKLGEYMLGVSMSSLEGVDLILFLVDDSKEIGRVDNKIISDLRKVKQDIILVINKTDLLNDEELAKLLENYQGLDLFKEIIPISAIDGRNVDKLIKLIKDNLEEGPRYYPEDYITDQPERFIIGELVREKALINLKEEVPHGVAVEVELVKDREKIVDIEATIYVEKESHKGIIIGKGGSMLKTIGSQARVEIERLLDKKVNLQLWVKVAKDWRDKEGRVKKFGYK